MSTELQRLFTAISEGQEACAMQCGKRNGCDATCCSFATMGGQPIVTEPERNLINSYLESLGGFTFHEAGKTACKFLGPDGNCKIHPVRPIDCRLHFCASDAMESQTNVEVEARVSDYHERNPLSYYHGKLLDSCTFRFE